jgi:hypothetical protein
MVPSFRWFRHPKEYTRPTIFISGMNLQKEGYTNIRPFITEWRKSSQNDNPLTGDVFKFAIGAFLFGDAVQKDGIFDFKAEIFKKVGENITISDEWYKYDVPGNIFFGFWGTELGFPKNIIHCGADFANDKNWCSGSDNLEDYNAI